jgi:hypothetical protein
VHSGPHIGLPKLHPALSEDRIGTVAMAINRAAMRAAFITTPSGCRVILGDTLVDIVSPPLPRWGIGDRFGCDGLPYCRGTTNGVG